MDTKLASMTAGEVAGHLRLISKTEVLKRVGVTFPTIWAWMRAGKFPRSRDIGGKVAWIESDIEAWIAGLPDKKYKGDGNIQQATKTQSGRVQV